MTVAEFIEKLKTFPQDIPVLIHSDCGHWLGIDECGGLGTLNTNNEDDFICCKDELPKDLTGEFLAIGG